MANLSDYCAVFSSRAQKEISKSWNWYEDRQPGLGDRFLKEVTDRILIIEQTPDKFPTRFKSYQEAQVPISPFLIIYKNEVLNPVYLHSPYSNAPSCINVQECDANEVKSWYLNPVQKNK